MRDLVKESIKKLDALYTGEERLIKGLSTGFRLLDNAISGLQKGHLTVVVGGPSMGKTAFVLSIAQQVACQQEIPVLFFSMRKSKEEIIRRMLTSKARVDFHKISSGFFSPSDWPKLTAAASVLSELRFYVDDRLLSIEEIEETIKYYVSEMGVGLVVIDALQEIEGGFYGPKYERRINMERFCNIIKKVAVEEDIPILLTYWAPTYFDEHHQQTPPLYVFKKEEGNLPCHADEIVMLYREEYYEPSEDNNGITTIRIIKPEAKLINVTALFHKEFLLFEDMPKGGVL